MAYILLSQVTKNKKTLYIFWRTPNITYQLIKQLHDIWASICAPLLQGTTFYCSMCLPACKIDLLHQMATIFMDMKNRKLLFFRDEALENRFCL